MPAFINKGEEMLIKFDRISESEIQVKESYEY
jgi:hypothetical protein